MIERIYPIDFRACEIEVRELRFDVFQDELKALHQAGFVHRGSKRPSGLPGDRHVTILLTKEGLRLIDAGISVLRHQAGEVQRLIGSTVPPGR